MHPGTRTGLWQNMQRENRPSLLLLLQQGLCTMPTPSIKVFPRYCCLPNKSDPYEFM